VVSAKVGEHDIAASFRLGALFHVEKPYETQDLLKKITVALTRGGGAEGEG
jgi:DNA-binding response OmpR family regulator